MSGDSTCFSKGEGKMARPDSDVLLHLISGSLNVFMYLCIGTTSEGKMGVGVIADCCKRFFLELV